MHRLKLLYIYTMSSEGIQRLDGRESNDSHPWSSGSLRRKEGEQIEINKSVRQAIMALLFGNHQGGFAPRHNVLSELSRLAECANIGELQNSSTYGLCVPDDVGKDQNSMPDSNLDLRPQDIKPGYDSDNQNKLKIGLQNIITHCGRTGEIAVGVWSDLSENIRQFVEQTLGKNSGQVNEVLSLAAKLHDIGKFLLYSEESSTLQNFYIGKKFEGQHSRAILEAFLLSHVIEGAKVLIGNEKNISSLEQLICASVALLHHRIHHAQPYPQRNDIQEYFSDVRISIPAARVDNFISFAENVYDFIEVLKTSSQQALKPESRTDDFSATVNKLISREETNKLALTVAIFCVVMNAVDIYDARLFDARNYHDQIAKLNQVLDAMRQSQMPEVICQILNKLYSGFSSKFGSGTSLR